MKTQAEMLSLLKSGEVIASRSFPYSRSEKKESRLQDKGKTRKHIEGNATHDMAARQGETPL